MTGSVWTSPVEVWALDWGKIEKVKSKEQMIMDMFVFPQLKQFKTFASTSSISIGAVPGTSALVQTKNFKKKKKEIPS